MSESKEKLKAMKELFEYLLEEDLEKEIMNQIIEDKNPDSIIRKLLKDYELK